MDDYVNGYIERTQGGRYAGRITIEGITLAPIEAQYFNQDGESYLWLRRRKVLEYDSKTMTYKEREATPSWQCYLKKQLNENTIAYKGEFCFLRFRFSIIGIWDRVLGKDKQHRLNLYVERLPLTQQTIINSINERKRNK